VKFESYPNPEKYVDDFFFGYMLAVGAADRQKILKEVKRTDFHFKRDSVLRMNLAKGLEPYRHDSLFTQSPKSVDSPWKNADDSALLHRETVQTAFQYPFALNLNECKGKTFKRNGPENKDANGLEFLLKAIGELNGVAGNHARSYYEMAPASIVIRLSESLVAGYNSYGFTKDGDFPEVIQGILKGDYPGAEFFIGGKIVKDMAETTQNDLEAKKVTLDRGAQRLIDTVIAKVLPK
jgi:CRISPR-associated protein Cst2